MPAFVARRESSATDILVVHGHHGHDLQFVVNSVQRLRHICGDGGAKGGEQGCLLLAVELRHCGVGPVVQETVQILQGFAGVDVRGLVRLEKACESLCEVADACHGIHSFLRVMMVDCAICHKASEIDKVINFTGLMAFYDLINFVKSERIAR